MLKLLKMLTGTIILLGVLYLSGRWAYSKLFTSDTQVVGAAGQPRYLNPVLAQSSLDKSLSTKIYRGLIKYDQNFEPVGDLLKSWQTKESGKVYLVNLKTGQFWQDGELITAEDVVFTFGLMNDLDAVTIQAVDDTTIKFTLPERLSSFTQVLARGILPQHIWQNQDLSSSEYNLKPVGSGEYEFKDISVDEDHVTSITFRRDAPAERLYTQYVFYNSTEELADAYKLGQIDRFKTTDKAVADTFKSWPNTVVTEANRQPPTANRFAVFFNLRDENSAVAAVANVATRRVLARKLADAGVELTGPLPKNHWAYVKHSIPAANMDLNDITLRILSLENVQTRLIASLTQAWAGANLETATTQFPPTDNWDVFVAPLEIPPDPDQYIYWHSTQADLDANGLNVSGYQNRRVDKALEDGRKLLNKDERQSAYDIVQRWLAQDVPAMFVDAAVVYNISRE